MAWVVDRRAETLRNAALNALDAAANRDGFAQQRVQTIMGVTRAAMGLGHTDGDQLVRDTAQVVTCLQRAQVAIHRAVSETKLVDIMMWVSDD
ncbi:MAG: hypothetical protein FWD75_07955 [Propionibacteriaceae bacterium]|nr:hypothetical protein [Propionibacteriaceae bacterium]